MKAFAPTLASAAIIEKFYGVDNGSQSIEVIKDAMELYNAYNRNEARKIMSFVVGMFRLNYKLHYTHTNKYIS